MKIALVTLFPEMFDALLHYGVSGRAVRLGLLEVQLLNPRSHTTDRHQTVDDRPYGGGPGMVLAIEPLRQCIKEAQKWIGGKSKVIYLSPQGRALNQKGVELLTAERNLILVAGRYEGVDERLIKLEVDEEWSIGDYVLSGGELPAMVIMDTIIRQLPGALGHHESAQQDSFSEGLLDYPHYTRPESYENLKVPDVLLSGNHESIRQWRLTESLKRTLQRRPDLLGNLKLNKEQQEILDSLVKDSISKESTDESN
jgi:tRNA (guanine37-N1)-methyltransferase|tara:strand:- start:3140 stop:3904 length:765 start_codon:yes stop_codon:yes gene_type:complete